MSKPIFSWDGKPLLRLGGIKNFDIDVTSITMYCPICGGKMIPQRIECSDKSGWMFGWGCNCTAELRDEQSELAEVIVHS